MHDHGGDSGIRECREAQQQAPKITTRYATSKDFIDFYGANPRGTVRAFVLLMDDVPHGFIGIIRENGIGKFFTENTDELRPYLNSISITRALYASRDWCRSYQGPVVSIAETVEGCIALNRMGFEHLEGVYYGWFDKWQQ
jgi:hypothetical protein